MTSFTTVVRSNPGATDAQVAAAERALGVTLPPDYLAQTRQADGAEGFVGNSYLVLWPLAQLRDLNEAYRVHEYAAGVLLFGSDGGLEGYGFDTRGGGNSIVRVPFDRMDWEYARPAGRTLNEFFEMLRRAT
jgi:hypothetical protein